MVEVNQKKSEEMFSSDLQPLLTVLYVSMVMLGTVKSWSHRFTQSRCKESYFDEKRGGSNRYCLAKKAPGRAVISFKT